MNILVLGGGGREHALAASLATQCDLETEVLYVAPGNAGTLECAENVNLPHEGPAIEAFCRRAGIDLVVVGPEAPLAAGLADHLTRAGIPVFGPTADCARLESSKLWAKAFMARHGVPTAAFQAFEHAAAARQYVEEAWTGAGMVIKADGLAGGKGVVVASTREQAIGAVFSLMERKVVGEAGGTLLVEERLVGPECTVLAIVDGQTYRLLPPAQDHKALYDGHRGPNTGGMGAVCPTPVVSADMLARIAAEIVEPTLAGLAAEGLAYRGVLYAGLILTAEGPRVLEFNCRFGDPEAQVVLPGVANLRDVLLAAATGRLAEVPVDHDGTVRVCVVAAAPGYPESYESDDTIEGLEEAVVVEGVTVFHAGTRLCERRGFLTRGGRVLGVTAEGADLAEAQSRAYQAMARINFGRGGPHYRHDIGVAALVEA
ncbi:MAG: phosphoribosylamine--glycine ligase [Candidatus Sericytochromatia bacterium]|nr:phosphoribosylamine--glycine ligase [Candidatus Tanganyikabacteria bacterium]